jgi:hypothetical protein
MSIGNELSCDVAAAVLAPRDERTQTPDRDLTGMILEFHSALRQLDGEDRRRRRSQILQTPLTNPSGGNSNAASGAL